MPVAINSVLQVLTFGELGWFSNGDELDIQSAGPNPGMKLN